MSRTLGIRSTLSKLIQTARLLVAAGLLLLGGMSLADDPIQNLNSETVLNLADGGYLTGSLVDSNGPGKVRWKSPAFVNPLDFAIDGVQSIRFPNSDQVPRPNGSFGFELTGGDTFYGSIVSLDDKFIEVEVSKVGRIRVERSRLRRIFRWRDGADLIYNGPTGLAGWREIPAAKRKKDPAAQAQGQGVQPVPQAPMGRQVVAMNVVVARIDGVQQVQPAAASPPKPVVPAGPDWEEEGGQLHSTKDGATIQNGIDLPSRSSLEIELSWTTTPDFAIAIGFADNEESVERAFRFEVWDKSIVAFRVLGKTAKLASIQTIKDGPGRLHLQLFLDQDQGKLLIFSATGESLGEIVLASQPKSTLGGFRLTNIRGDIKLERLRIGRWDGETPRPSKNDVSRVQLTDLSSVRGQVERFDPTAREFIVKAETGETRVSEEKVSDINLALAEGTSSLPVRAVYRDGTRISGEWVKVEGGSLVVSSPGVAEPIKLPMDGLRSLDMPPREAKPSDNPPWVGRLELEGVWLLGKLVDSGDRPGEGALAWQPVLGESSSPILPGASGSIFYKTTVASPVKGTIVQQSIDRRVAAQREAELAVARQRALLNNQAVNLNRAGGMMVETQALPKTKSKGNRSLYLRSGDIIPVEVLKIDEQGVTFRSDLSLNGFVPHARIKAVELANETNMPIRLSKTKFDRLMTLPRVQRDSPPTHLIRSKTGDMLRGRIVAMDDKTIRIEIRLEEKEIPRDRVSRIIWLHPDESDPSKKVAEPPVMPVKNRVQAVRSDGIRLTYNADRFADNTLIGKSDVVGDCKVRMEDLDTLLIGGAVEKEATQLAYQNWKLQNAPDPKSALSDDESSPNGGAAGTESALVGKPAPDFELDLVGGNKFHLADNKGKVIVLDFWATWCGPCIQAMPQIDRVTHEFADKGVQLVAVNLQESPDKIKAMLERLKLDPTVALDRDGVVASRYAANAIPQTVVIDREGKITRLFIGGGPKLGDQLRDALQSLMPKDNP